MPEYYKIDKERRLVVSTGSGVLTLTDIWAHQEKLLKDPDFDPSFSQLMDVTQVTGLELSSHDVQSVAGKSIFSPNSRQAILVSRDVDFGLARMFEILRGLKGEEGVRVFRDSDDALDWVLAKNNAV